MNEETDTQRGTETEPQPKPEMSRAEPSASMASQSVGWAGASPTQVMRTVAIALLTTAVVAWRVLLALAGQDLHRLVRHRPLSGSGAQPCGQLAPAPTQAHEAPPRHRAHLPGSIGGAALGGGDLRARAHRPDKRLHQVRHHRGQRPRGSDAIHQGARQG